MIGVNVVAGDMGVSIHVVKFSLSAKYAQRRRMTVAAWRCNQTRPHR